MYGFVRLWRLGKAVPASLFDKRGRGHVNQILERLVVTAKRCSDSRFDEVITRNVERICRQHRFTPRAGL